MNLRHLRCFQELSQELHFGRAAQKLFIAQPPLSKIIKDLEAELGVSLFNRSRRRVELSVCGAFLKAEVEKLFLQIDHMKTGIREIGEGKTGSIRIGYVGAAMHSVLPDILIRLRENLDLKIALFELKNQEQIDALSLGQIDLGFVRSVPEKRDVLARPVLSEPFSLILPLGHRLAKKQRIHLKEMAGEPFVGLSYDCAPQLCDTILDICQEAGFSPRMAHETSQINSIVRLVESGLGYSIVPASVRNAYSLQVRFWELKQFKQRARLYLLHKREMPPLVSNCVRLIIEKVPLLLP
jgi:DNA-binding transcriptional LysR family regulator